MKEIVIYKTKDNKTQIDVTIENDSVWLTQQQMADLSKQTKQNISLQINNCFKEKELYEKSVVKDSLTTASDGKRYNTKHYNLDVIISVGYRVKSIRGTQFRQWATARLNQYLIQGIVLNEKRLDQQNKRIQVLHDGIRILSRAIEEKKPLRRIISGYMNLKWGYSSWKITITRDWIKWAEIQQRQFIRQPMNTSN